MINVIEVADNADVIINGYAFTKCDIGIKVLNLNNPQKAVLFSFDNDILETTMNDIELSIAKKYLISSKKYMED